MGGVKRPASAHGGDGKRQRTEALRVPGWKAKAAEAVDVSDQFALEDVNSKFALALRPESILTIACKKLWCCVLGPSSYVDLVSSHKKGPLTPGSARWFACMLT